MSQTNWLRWESRHFLSLPIVQTLLPVTFGYSLSSEVVVMRQLRSERGCNKSHWHAHTRGLRWGLPEVIGTVQQVHCSRRRLLWRGLEFHVCTINKSAHTKKRLETYLMILVSSSQVKRLVVPKHFLWLSLLQLENTLTVTQPQWLSWIWH